MLAKQNNVEMKSGKVLFEEEEVVVTRIIKKKIEQFIESYEDISIENLFKKIKYLEDEVERLKTCNQPYVISDSEAEEKIKSYLIDLKKKGIKKVSIIDIIERLHLPAEQIDKIMEKLKNNGVREID